MKLEAFPRKSEVVGRAAINIAGGVKGRVLAGALLLVAFGTACGGAASGGSSNETAAAALNRGLAASAAGKLGEAVAAYFTALSEDANNQFAYDNLAQMAP